MSAIVLFALTQLSVHAYLERACTDKSCAETCATVAVGNGACAATAGRCLVQGAGAGMIATCSPDGTMISITLFNDAACTLAVDSWKAPTSTCYTRHGVAGYCAFSCGPVDRPVAATPVQTANSAKVHKVATTLSSKAKPDLLKALNNSAFKDAVKNVSALKGKNDEELLQILWEEIHLAPIMRNIPVSTVAALHHNNYNNDDDRHHNDSILRRRLRGSAPLPTLIKWGYSPTVWQEIAEGAVTMQPQWLKLDTTEITILKYPTMVHPATKPTAWDRPVYGGLQLWRKTGGDLALGNVSLVLDRVALASSIVLSPIDTGHYTRHCPTPGDEPCKDWDQSLGNVTDFYHLILPHVNFWKTHLSDLFLRWFDPSAKVKLPYLPYIEADIAQSVLLPENLVLVIMNYAAGFHNADGTTVRAWCHDTLHKPLGWTDTVDLGIVLDASVNMIDGNYSVTSADKKDFASILNDTSATFPAYQKKASWSLHLEFLNSQNFKECNALHCQPCKLLGVNRHSQCLFWKGR